MAQGVLAPLSCDLALLKFRDLPPRCDLALLQLGDLPPRCRDLPLRCSLALRRLLPLRLPLRLGRGGVGARVEVRVRA